MKNIKKIGHILTDSVWSILGTVIMTFASQFLVYPFWERLFGSEKYGNIIYLLSLMNIVSITFGSAAGYTRIMISSKRKTHNCPYILLLLVLSSITLLYSSAVSFLNRDTLNQADVVGYIVLCTITAWRCYADVEYRIHLNYKGFFLYYTLIGAGYVLGIFLIRFFYTWTAALIPGELSGLIYVLSKGHIFRKDELVKDEFSEMSRMFLVLAGSNLINTLIFNADRILIRNAVSSIAVSIYYISSLFGKTLSLITTPLNGVISGYIARFKGVPSTKTRYIIAISATVMSVLAAFICTLGAYIILPFLYPETFPQAKGSVFVCSIAQTIYFSTNIISVIMLRFSDKKHQIFSNAVYAAAFVLICIPMTILFDMPGFYIGFIITSCSRFIYDIIIILM